MELRWRPSVSASCFYAVECLRRGEPFVDPLLADALREPASRLTFELEEAGVPCEGLIEHLAPLSAQLDSNRELAVAGLTKVLGAGRALELRNLVAGRISDLESAFALAVPKAAEELPLRVEPLRLQWEARGPGLLHCLARLTEPELIAEQAEVVLVQPLCGGGGRAYRRYNQATFEALLTDPEPALPEIMRLAWFLAQLQLDLPRYHDRLSNSQLDVVAPPAMLVAVLAAAEDVELACCDEPTIASALAHWHVGAHYRADQLAGWWEECTTSRPAWPVALQALQRIQESATSEK